MCLLFFFFNLINVYFSPFLFLTFNHLFLPTSIGFFFFIIFVLYKYYNYNFTKNKYKSVTVDLTINKALQRID